MISIHTLHAEGDFIRAPYPAGWSDFYPHPPCGG